MVVDRDVHSTVRQKGDGSIQFLLIVYGIDPKAFEIRSGEASNFEAHERQMINERQIAREKFRKLWQPRVGLTVNDDTNFDLLPVSLEI